jgi:hypothetical protein
VIVVCGRLRDWQQETRGLSPTGILDCPQLPNTLRLFFMLTGIPKKEETYAVLRGHKGAADR